jgi:predicted dehydrogenase
MTARGGVGIVDGRAAATAASLSRRSFTRLATAGFFAAQGQGAPATEGLADRLNLAVVGIGGRGAANLAAVSRHNIVALCDVDDRRVGKAYEEHPRARRFADFRRMFDSLERQIDGVVISTPDHTHFHTAWWALERGKHVYLEKPLAHEVEEVRRLTEAARRRGLATQQGMQRHATPGLRAGVEIVKAGLIGEVREVHSWVNSTRGLPEPKPEPLPVPAGLDWDLWLGPLPPRPYTQGFAPYDWRFWWEFGSGEAGNWGCHILDIPFWALELGHPTHVTASGPAPDPARTPREFASTLLFPARRRRDGQGSQHAVRRVRGDAGVRIPGLDAAARNRVRRRETGSPVAPSDARLLPGMDRCLPGRAAGDLRLLRHRSADRGGALGQCRLPGAGRIRLGRRGHEEQP